MGFVIYELVGWVGFRCKVVSWCGVVIYVTLAKEGSYIVRVNISSFEQIQIKTN